MSKIHNKGSNSCGWGFREKESLIKWYNVKKFLKNTDCPATAQPSSWPPGIYFRQMKNWKLFLGMFIMFWFIKAPNWNLVDDRGLNRLQYIYSMEQRKREQISGSSIPCDFPYMRRKCHRTGEKIRERERQARGCVDLQGNTDDPCGDGRTLHVYYDVNTLFVEFYCSFPSWYYGRQKGKSGYWRKDIWLC